MARYINKDELIKRLSTGCIPADDNSQEINVYRSKKLEMDDLTTRCVLSCVMLIVNSMDDSSIDIYPREIKAEKIRAARLEKKMSLSQLSRKSGVSLKHLHKIENGLCKPFPQTIVKIADALGVKAESLQ